MQFSILSAVLAGALAVTATPINDAVVLERAGSDLEARGKFEHTFDLYYTANHCYMWVKSCSC